MRIGRLERGGSLGASTGMTICLALYADRIRKAMASNGSVDAIGKSQTSRSLRQQIFNAMEGIVPGVVALTTFE
jgi:hypothetical protein